MLPDWVTSVDVDSFTWRRRVDYNSYRAGKCHVGVQLILENSRTNDYLCLHGRTHQEVLEKELPPALLEDVTIAYVEFELMNVPNATTWRDLPLRTYPGWIDRIGVGRIQWSWVFARSRKYKRTRQEMERVLDLKLTARLGGQHISYMRTTVEDLARENFPPALMEEITTSYAEFLLLGKQQPRSAEDGTPAYYPFA